MAEDKYWFPELNLQEIMADLSSWEQPVSMELIKRPTSSWVCEIYGFCLQMVTEIDLQSLQDPTQDALNSLEDPKSEIYSAGLSQNVFLYHMTRFAEYARVTDFSAKDLYQPEPGRTQIVLSAFINFVKFVQEWQPITSDYEESSFKLVEERDSVSKQLAAAEAQLAAAKAQLAKDEPECNVLQSENANITAHLVSMKEMQKKLMSEHTTLKEERSDIAKRQEALGQEISMASDSVARTQARIVRSPERIKRTIVTMGSTAAEDKRSLAMNEAKVRDLQAKITALLSIEKDIRSCVEQLQTIEKEVTHLDKAQKGLTDLKDHLDHKQIESNEFQMKQDRVTKQFQNAQEKLDRAQKHAEDKRLGSQKTIERLQQEYEQMALERRDNDKQMDELRKEADDVATRTAEHHKKSEAELQELMTEYWKLRHEAEMYMEILASKLKLKLPSE